MLWTWRKHASTTHLTRIWLPLIMGALTLSGFTVAGIFFSRVGTSRGGEVLLVGNHCATRGLRARLMIFLQDVQLAMRMKDYIENLS
jgi:hypothetical protein